MNLRTLTTILAFSLVGSEVRAECKWFLPANQAFLCVDDVDQDCGLDAKLVDATGGTKEADLQVPDPCGLKPGALAKIVHDYAMKNAGVPAEACSVKAKGNACQLEVGIVVTSKKSKKHLSYVVSAAKVAVAKGDVKCMDKACDSIELRGASYAKDHGALVIWVQEVDGLGDENHPPSFVNHYRIVKIER